MDRSVLSVCRVSFAAVAVCVLPAAVSAEEANQPCTLDPGPSATVARILDAETIALDSGREVRLIGALAPRARDAGAEPGTWDPEQQALTKLTSLVLGKKVKLAFGGRQTDRYGRYLAQVFIDDRGEEWVQGAMLAAGLARTYALPGNAACGRELMAHEAQARTAKLGVWANGAYRLFPSKNTALLLQQRGRFVRVIGEIAKVARTKNATFLNFTNDWKSDFTVRLGKAALAANPAFDRSLSNLEGKTIIARGWIERRGGPLIEIYDAANLEIVEGASPPAVSSNQARPESSAKPASSELESPEPGGPEKVRPAPTEGAEPGAVDL